MKLRHWLVTPQMSMKRGIKVFSKDVVTAVKKEMLQLHDRKVMAPKQAKELTPEQKKEALAYLMFLKHKCCGKIKGWGCANGQKEHTYTACKDTASSTVVTESIFLMAVIDTLQDHHMAIIDIPGAFMQADIDELVHVRFKFSKTILPTLAQHDIKCGKFNFEFLNCLVSY
jgi:hypothetical protein